MKNRLAAACALVCLVLAVGMGAYGTYQVISDWNAVPRAIPPTAEEQKAYRDQLKKAWFPDMK